VRVKVLKGIMRVNSVMLIDSEGQVDDGSQSRLMRLVDRLIDGTLLRRLD